ncbi:hypothetical protein L7F22_043684 [Adiantum nelumboides]|nr:hypothetical protein [Adiantum nelumboides]
MSMGFARGAFRASATIRDKSSLESILKKRPDDVVFTTALRTPVARMKKGYKDAYPEELLAFVLQKTRERLENKGVPIDSIEDICTGTVLMELGGAKRQINVGIAAGVESMTRDWGTRAIPVKLSPAMAQSPNQDARDCLMSMGLTSENVASQWKIGREEQDQFAATSQQRAAAAQEDGVRKGTTKETLAKLKPAFKEDGTSTAGNSSQVSDGAVALTMARRDVAEKLGMEILGKWVGTSTIGVKPDIMGVGPAYASPKLLNRFGLDAKEIDLWEINEAFASQVLMTMGHLGISHDQVNVKGGAIALGHPLGASGGRLVTSLLAELRRTVDKPV